MPATVDRAMIQNGSTGGDVVVLQEWLRDLGYGHLLGDYGPNGDGVDGHFGSATESAVFAFQTDAGIGIDGIVGPETWGAIQSAVSSGSTGAPSGGASSGGAPSGGAAPAVAPIAGGTSGGAPPPNEDTTVVNVPVVVEDPPTFEYRIVWGDTLSGVAVRFDTTVDAIVAENGIANPDLIHEGQVIRVPSGSYTAPGSTPDYIPVGQLNDPNVQWIAIDFETHADAQAVRDAVAAGGFVGMDPDETLTLGDIMRQVQGFTDDIAIELSAIESITGLTTGLGGQITGMGENMTHAGGIVIDRAALAGGYQIATVSYGGDALSGTSNGGLSGSAPRPGSGGATPPTITAGSRGSLVGTLQEALALLGYSPGTADRIFGPLTKGAVERFQTAEGIGVDGIVGPVTWGALRGALERRGGPEAAALIGQMNAAPTSPPAASGSYARTSLNLGPMDPRGLLSSPNVNPELARRVAAVLRDLSAAGYRPKVQEGYRTFERQQSLYNQGRSTPGNIVTGARAGRSFHNYGLAIDIVMQGSNPYRDKSPFWDALGAAAARHGLTWGGNWRRPDRPHVELHPGLTASQAGTLLDEYQSGGLQEVWASLGIAGTSGPGAQSSPGRTAASSTFNPDQVLYLSDLPGELQRLSSDYREQLAFLGIAAVVGVNLTQSQLQLEATRRTVLHGDTNLPPGTIAQVDAATWVYIVNRGDQLAGIAAAFDVSWRQLATANNINPDRINIGQAIIITNPGDVPTGQGPADWTQIDEFGSLRGSGSDVHDPLYLSGGDIWNHQDGNSGAGNVDTSGIPRTGDIFKPLATKIDQLVDTIGTAVMNRLPSSAIYELRAELATLIDRVTDNSLQAAILSGLLAQDWGAETAIAVAIVWNRENPLLNADDVIAAFEEQSVRETFGRALYARASAEYAAELAYSAFARSAVHGHLGALGQLQAMLEWANRLNFMPVDKFAANLAVVIGELGNATRWPVNLDFATAVRNAREDSEYEHASQRSAEFDEVFQEFLSLTQNVWPMWTTQNADAYRRANEITNRSSDREVEAAIAYLSTILEVDRSGLIHVTSLDAHGLSVSVSRAAALRRRLLDLQVVDHYTDPDHVPEIPPSIDELFDLVYANDGSGRTGAEALEVLRLLLDPAVREMFLSLGEQLNTGYAGGLYFEVIDEIALSDNVHRRFDLLSLYGQPTTLAEVIGKAGVTMPESEVLRLAKLIQRHPGVFNMLGDNTSGTKVLQLGRQQGNGPKNVDAIDDDRRRRNVGITDAEVAKFLQDMQIRGLFFGDLHAIDTISDSDVDGTLTEEDFRRFVEESSLPVSMKELLNRAVDNGLADDDNWDKALVALELAGLALAIASIPASGPVAFALAMAGLAVDGAALAIGLGTGAYGSEQALLSLIGIGLGVTDVRTAASAGGLAFARRLDIEDMYYASPEVQLFVDRLSRAVDKRWDSGELSWPEFEAAYQAFVPNGKYANGGRDTLGRSLRDRFEAGHRFNWTSGNRWGSPVGATPPPVATRQIDELGTATTRDVDGVVTTEIRGNDGEWIGIAEQGDPFRATNADGDLVRVNFRGHVVYEALPTPIATERILRANMPKALQDLLRQRDSATETAVKAALSADIGEELADIGVRQHLTAKYLGARVDLIKGPGGGHVSGEFDLIYRVNGADGSQRYVVVEAKGGSGGLGTRRRDGGDIDFEQGTSEYAISIAEKIDDPVLREDLIDALLDEQADYLLITEVGTTTATQTSASVKIQDFDMERRPQ